MKLSLSSIVFVGLAQIFSAQAAHAGSVCQTASLVGSGTYHLSLHDDFTYPNYWDTTNDWFRVVLQPGDQLTAQVTNVAVSYGTLWYGEFTLWERDPVNCTGLQVADTYYPPTATVTTVNNTAAPKEYVLLLYFISANDYISMGLTCDLSVSITPGLCPGVPDDAFEPNSYFGVAMLPPGTYPNLLATSANDDWYRVIVPIGATLAAQINFSNAAGDLDLDVGSHSSTSTNDFEFATATNPGSGLTILVHVHAKDGLLGVCNHYNLTLTITHPALWTSYCVGAPNSTGFGASLMATGTTSLSSNPPLFLATGLPSGAPALLYDGTAQVQTPFGDGFRCVGGSTHRIATHFTQSDGSVVYLINYGALPPATVISPGSTWNFQVYYRNIAGPGGTGFNLSNAITITFQP